MTSSFHTNLSKFDSVFNSKLKDIPNPKRYIEIIQAQFCKAIKEPVEYCIYARDDEAINIIYILIRNLRGKNDELVGGEYLFKMILTEEHPDKPPRFIAMTPNGVFAHGQRCCINIGEYHPENYDPRTGIMAFAIELANGLMNREELKGGINLLMKTTVDEMKLLAKESISYNDKMWPREMNLIRGQYIEYSKDWKKPEKVENPKAETDNFGEDDF